MKKELKDNSLRRINKIYGQVGGIRQMIQEEKEPGDILKQLAAARGAINSLSSMLLEDLLRTEITLAAKKKKETRNVVEEIVRLFGKFSR